MAGAGERSKDTDITNERQIPNSHSKMLTLVHSFFSSCGGLRFLRMDSPRISSAVGIVNRNHNKPY